MISRISRESLACAAFSFLTMRRLLPSWGRGCRELRSWRLPRSPQRKRHLLRLNRSSHPLSKPLNQTPRRKQKKILLISTGARKAAKGLNSVRKTTHSLLMTLQGRRLTLKRRKMLKSGFRRTQRLPLLLSRIWSGKKNLCRI